MSNYTTYYDDLWQGDQYLRQPGSNIAAALGLESLIQYNGMTINDKSVEDKYLVTSIDGLSALSIRSVSETNPNGHGELPGDNYLGPRVITISGEIHAGNLGKLRDMQQALRDRFTSMVERPLVFRNLINPAGSVQINCRIAGEIQMPETQPNGKMNRSFQITLKATNPRFYALTKKTIRFNFGYNEQFSSDTIASGKWTKTGPSTVTISGGKLAFTTNGTLTNVTLADLATKPHQLNQWLTFATPGSMPVGSIGMFLKKLDANNWLAAVININGASSTLSVLRTVAGTTSTIATSSTFNMSASTNKTFHLGAKQVGNEIRLALFDDSHEPAAYNTAYNAYAFPNAWQSVTLTSTDATNYGGAVVGDVGILFAFTTSSVTVDRYRLLPIDIPTTVFSITNWGNFEAQPVITFSGRMFNPTVYNLTTTEEYPVARFVKIDGIVWDSADWNVGPSTAFEGGTMFPVLESIWQYDSQGDRDRLVDISQVSVQQLPNFTNQRFGRYNINSRSPKIFKGDNNFQIYADPIPSLIGASPLIGYSPSPLMDQAPWLDHTYIEFSFYDTSI